MHICACNQTLSHRTAMLKTHNGSNPNNKMRPHTTRRSLAKNEILVGDVKEDMYVYIHIYIFVYSYKCVSYYYMWLESGSDFSHRDGMHLDGCVLVIVGHFEKEHKSGPQHI